MGRNSQRRREVIMANRLKGAGGALVAKCPRCGRLAPLTAKGLFARYPDGICTVCVVSNVETLMKGFREQAEVVGRFLNERGVTKPNEVCPRGEALYQALLRAVSAGPLPGCDAPPAGPIRPPAGPCPDCMMDDPADA